MNHAFSYWEVLLLSKDDAWDFYSSPKEYSLIISMPEWQNIHIGHFSVALG